MDKRKLSQARRSRFSEVLRRYREQHGLSLRELVDLLQCPRSTVLFWLSGDRMPSAPQLPKICARININPELLFGSSITRDVFYDQQILGLESLQLRYFEVKQHDPLRALDYLSVAAALTFNYLTHKGVECRLQVQHDYATCVQFIHPSIANLTLAIHARGGDGIGFVVILPTNRPLQEWKRLTNSNLDSFIDYIQAQFQS